MPMDSNGLISYGNDYDKLQLFKLNIVENIEGAFCGTITGIDEKNNLFFVKKHYQLIKNKKPTDGAILRCVAVCPLFFDFPYNVGDRVVVLKTMINAESFIKNSKPYLHNVYEVNDYYEEINNIIVFNFNIAGINNRDTITIKIGKAKLKIKSDGSCEVDNTKCKVNLTKDGEIQLNNVNGEISIDETGLTTIQNKTQQKSALMILQEIIDCMNALMPNPALTPPNDYATKLSILMQDMVKVFK